MQNYTEQNSKAIDMWVDEGWEWGTPISHEVFEKSKNGDWGVLLTPIEDIDSGSLLSKYNFPEYIATRAIKLNKQFI